MPRKQGKAVPEGSGPIPQHDEFRPDQPMLVGMYRVFEERFDRRLNIMKIHFDQQDEKLDELVEKMRKTRQRLVGLEQGAWQPRLATKVDVEPDTKTYKRTEDAAADRAKHIGDSSSVKRVDIDPTSLTSFGMIAERPALPSRDDALVDKGDAAPKPCLSSVEIRTLAAAGGLLSADTTSTATRTIFHQPPLWFSPIEKMNSRTTSIQHATYYSGF